MTASHDPPKFLVSEVLNLKPYPVSGDEVKYPFDIYGRKGHTIFL